MTHTEGNVAKVDIRDNWLFSKMFLALYKTIQEEIESDEEGDEDKR